MVQRTRRELLASLSDPQQISGKVEAYTNAIRRHREFIFSDILRETRSTRASARAATVRGCEIISISGAPLQSELRP